TLGTNEVMQGVFRLAGIWDLRDKLLAANNRKNEDTLRVASETLTSKIQSNWTQGKDLNFWLGYVGNDIRLSVKDTAATITAVGERSAGFTSYFAMRMLLVARTDAAKPQGYVFMFDEPGLNLHPKGQVDLQNVFEDIARNNQIVYSTHSVFLINKNYPDRNHLIFKNEDGSNVVKKPFLGGWAKVKEHLGLYLSSNFLFSEKILLAEGASDEIYLPLIFQGLIDRNKFEGDLNAFAMHTSLNDSETVACADIYTREDRTVVVLVDGDEAGANRKNLVEKWAKKKKRKCSVVSLGDLKQNENSSMEDFLEPGIYKDAVIQACTEAVDQGVIVPKSPSWETELKAQIVAKENKSLGKRTEEILTTLFGESLGKIWIARKYGELLRSEDSRLSADVEQYWNDALLLRLAKTIWMALDLPLRGDAKALRFTEGS
ncbi:MAG TPA: AAA family ATPase, partial [Verrucomicrobiae bacterium]|nr:AAA family ATPase [Verrucomicrobiae bacterium]